MSENGYYVHDSEHFPTFEERARSSTRQFTRDRRAVSPSHSAHGALIRASIVRKQTDKKAKKVRFYRNGDLFFKGMVYAVSVERFRTFESLLAELTQSPICDKNYMPNGVRCIFSLDGNRKITDIEQLEEEESYVCASTNFFKKLDYPKGNTPKWNPNINQRTDSEMGIQINKEYMDDHRDFIRPKLITVIRNGSKPRKAVRILLNKKTAHSMDQVLNDINDAIKLDTGSVRKVFTLDGKPILQLQDFFADDTVFIAYGPEKYTMDDFDLSGNEIRFVSAYKTTRQRERITLRSPKPSRRSFSTSSSNKSLSSVASSGYTSSGYNRQSTGTGHSSRVTPVSPRTPRRSTPKSPGRSKVTNGTNGTNGTTNGNGSLTNGHDTPPPMVSPPPLYGDGSAPPVELSERYKISKVIGEGNFAVVKECIHRSSRKNYALKVINKSKCKGKERMIDNEVSIMRLVKHPNIIQLIEDYDTPTELYLVMELVKGGDLFDAITTSTKYTERDASGMLYNLLNAITYLHSLNIVHRDIKPENLLVSEYSDGSKALKLGDFGLATEVNEPLYVVCGTPTYVAPEVLAETGYGVKVDLWSAGVICFILLSGFPPFVSPTNDQEELFDLIIEGKFSFTSPFWDDISHSAKELISMMLVDVEQRLSATEALSHPWVAEDLAKDEDMHNQVASHLDANFASRKQKSREQQAGVAVITTTALDKGSRFFQGRKQIPLQEYDGQETDEVF